MSADHLNNHTMSAESNQTRTRRIAVMGARSVGKSSLVIQFCENHFVESYYPTIENTFTKTIKQDGKEYSVEIMDTAGQDEFTIYNQYSNVHGFVLAYSITSKSSFDMVKIIHDKILNYHGTENIPCVIVGNKSDLDMQRQVKKEEGKELIEEMKNKGSANCQFFEVSAKHNENVDKVFTELIKSIERANNPPQEDKGGCTIS